MLKTHDLIHCNTLIPLLPSVNDSGVYPYNGLILRFDNDEQKTYRVKKNVQGRFLHPEMPISKSIDFPAGTKVEFTVDSMQFNGIEYVIGVPAISLLFDDLAYTSYPYYTVGNEYSYTNNIANGVNVSSSPIDLGNNYNNFYWFIEGLINLYDIPVNITRTPSLWWAPDEFVRLDNFTIEKHYDTVFEYTITLKYYDLTDDSLVFTQENRYVFDNETVIHFVNGTNIEEINPGEAPQFSDEYSFFSYNFSYDTLEELDSCPSYLPFNASIRKDGCPSITTDCDCTKFSFIDGSNYINSLPGHNPEFFNSRTFTITKPDGSTYVLATADVADRDETIGPHYNSSNNFAYQFTEDDEDGVYEIELCTYPDWQSDVLYQVVTNTIVNRNGKLYKVIASNTNVDPALPAGATYWTEYSCIGDCDKTRYCTKERVVVLCISLLKCYKNLVKSALCEVAAAPCAKDMSDNKKFMDAMKFKVVLDSLEFSACDERWDLVEKDMDLLKTICCCDS